MQDLRDAFRTLRASPVVSAAAILSLALGIGANTALFSILNSLLLKPLPVADPASLIAIASEVPGEDGPTSYPIWRELRDRQVFDRAFVWAPDRTSIASGDATAALETIWASGTFFEVLGVPALAGRTFGEHDDRPGGGPDGPVAVIGYRFAERRFGDATASIGKPIVIERVPYTIVGVTPPNFFGLEVGRSFDVILPLETEPLLGRSPARLSSPFWPWLRVTARLRPGSTIETATAAIRAVQPQIREATLPPSARPEAREAFLRKPWTMRPAGTGSSGFRSRYGQALVILLALVGVVLLIACANIANLQLARAADRRYQFALRAALGASRLRIARALLAESLLLSAVGTALGFLFAQRAGPLVVAQLSTWAYTAFFDLSPDWRVLAVTATVMVSATMLFGTVPAVRAARVDPIDALKQGGRGPSGRAGALSGGLVIAQVALSLLLVVGGAWFLRSFAALAYRDLGFDRGRILVAIVDARRTGAVPGGRSALYDRVREAVAAVPGVERAALSMATPLGSAGMRFTPRVEVPDRASSAQGVRVFMVPVSPGWFQTFGTQLIAGRDFEVRDDNAAADVAVVNEAFARRFSGGEVPLGRELIVDGKPLEVVGIVRDAAFVSVREPLEPTLYRPLAQGVEEQQFASVPTISVSVRAADGLAPAALARTVTSAIGGVDRNLSVSFQTVDEHLNPHYIRERLLALLSGFFGGLALLLAAVGLYGVTAYSVGQRRAEIGVRIALGAGRRDVLRLVLRRVAALAGIGVAIGVVASLWAARFVAALLFDTPARDPLTVATCALLLVLVCSVAGWLPARRAARLDPAVVLREG